jgi:hypothetical protein
MSAIMSIRSATACSDAAMVWRPQSLGPVIGIEENFLRASVGGETRLTQVKPTVLGPQPWVSDDECSCCPLCKRKFHPFFRKHHCRMCGNVICSKCSPSRVSLPDLGYQNLVRVCSSCFRHRNVENPFDAVDGGAASQLPSGSAPGAVSGDIPRRLSADGSRASSVFGPTTPPPARSALDVIADSQKRALDSRTKIAEAEQ